MIFIVKRKKSMTFSAEKNGEPLVFQVGGNLTFEENDDPTLAGLCPVRLQACHTETNLNRSTISYETMENKLLPTFKNRPILGFIHDVDGKPQFYTHNALKKMAKLFMTKLLLVTSRKQIMQSLFMTKKTIDI
ncbi:hypothetical protein [Eubacterium ramulus]|uniref:hypothetical protein n=1 Tax=Eubacterium ramulus TaxID=39490 RepID=UPI00399A0794